MSFSKPTYRAINIILLFFSVSFYTLAEKTGFNEIENK